MCFEFNTNVLGQQKVISKIVELFFYLVYFQHIHTAVVPFILNYLLIHIMNIPTHTAQSVKD